jgi:DNA-binding YbaB/EbfC family protein
MFDQAKMLWKAKQVQKELKNTEIEAQSNDGVVKVVVNCEMHIKSIELDENALKPENKRALEKTLQNTLGEAMSRAQALAAQKTKDVMKDMNLNIPGM